MKERGRHLGDIESRQDIGLSPALKAVLLIFVLIAAQPAQTKSPEISLKPVPAANGLLGGAYRMNSYPANSLTGPLLYLPTSITLLSSESVAVRAWGSTAGKPYRHGVLDVAADSVERKRAAGQIGSVSIELELVGTGRGVVQIVAAELPQRRNPELANVDAILH
jgi:hypothetical protein